MLPARVREGEVEEGEEEEGGRMRTRQGALCPGSVTIAYCPPPCRERDAFCACVRGIGRGSACVLGRGGGIEDGRDEEEEAEREEEEEGKGAGEQERETEEEEAE